MYYLLPLSFQKLCPISRSDKSSTLCTHLSNTTIPLRTCIKWCSQQERFYFSLFIYFLHACPSIQTFLAFLSNKNPSVSQEKRGRKASTTKTNYILKSISFSQETVRCHLLESSHPPALRGILDHQVVQGTQAGRNLITSIYLLGKLRWWCRRHGRCENKEEHI